MAKRKARVLGGLSGTRLGALWAVLKAGWMGLASGGEMGPMSGSESGVKPSGCPKAPRWSATRSGSRWVPRWWANPWGSLKEPKCSAAASLAAVLEVASAVLLMGRCRCRCSSTRVWC